MSAVVAVIPAHDESDCIVDAIRSLRWQTRPVDRIVVAADNCTDFTAMVAHLTGAEVLVTQGNTDKRAGAVNAAVRRVLPDLSDDDYLFVLDADTTICRTFVETALAKIGDHGALGPSFRGGPGTGLIHLLQQNEYVRISRKVSRRGATPFVLSGACEFLPVPTVRAVLAARESGALPPGVLYAPEAIAEDWELTVGLRTLGFTITAPMDCLAWTDVESTHRGLFRQRDRWQKGYLEVLRLYGYSRVTRPAFVHQIGLYAGTLLMPVWFFVMVMALLVGWRWSMNPWLAAGFALVLFERAWSVRECGWRNALAAASFLPELGYEWWKNVVFWWSGIRFVRRAPDVW